MLRDTHIAAGASAALLFTRPQGLLPAIGVVLSAVCGSVISDIDADRSWARKQADVLICAAAAGLEAAVLVATVSGQIASVVETIGTLGCIEKLAAWVLAVIICMFGMKQEHRWFMHSFAAGAALTACVHVALSRQQACVFLAGFLSHLVLDLPNHKDMRLFWPLKKGFCLHLCTSDGVVNKILGAAFLVICVLLFDACAGLGLCSCVESLVENV